LESSADLLRQQILLQAKELCIDILTLQQQRDLLGERLQQAEQLAAFYKRRLDTGDANILEINKTNLELLNARTEWRNTQVALQKAWSDLQLLNGGRKLLDNTQKPVDSAQARMADYPLPPLPDYAQLRNQYLAASPALLQLNSESEAARRQMIVDRQGWLPKLELGYRRNTESHLGFSGIVAGISLPLFSNRYKAKAAQWQWSAAEARRDNAVRQTESDLTQLYDEASTLLRSIREYNAALQGGRDLKLLRQAIEGGQINVTEYFVEVAVVCQSKQNLLNLENRYRKIVAQINRNSL
jgi:outer membrane protein TolC